MNYAEVRLIKTPRGTEVYIKIATTWHYKLFAPHFQPGQILNAIECGATFIPPWEQKDPT